MSTIMQDLKSTTSIDCLPPELLQHIFHLVVSYYDYDFEDSDDRRNICLVCKYWSSIAISHPILWTYDFPPLRIPQDAAHAQSANTRLRMCLTRSGSLPLDLASHVEYKDWTERKELVLTTMSLMTNECHRWRRVSLTLPVEAWDPVLSRVRGHVPMLKIFAFATPFSEPLEDLSSPTFDYFAEAPSLDDLMFDTYWDGAALERNGLDVVFPWSQLTSFSGWLPRCHIYRDIMSQAGSNLIDIRYRCRTGKTPYPQGPSTVTFPFLTDYDFSESLETTEENFAYHLDTLNLPSLKYLRIVNSNAPSEVFTQKLLSLVQRSHCPLVKLITNTISNTPAFMNLLSLCPTIVDLSVRNISAEYLLQLALDANTSDPILPNLRKLRIVSRALEALTELDAPALMQMVESRTFAMVHNDPQTPGSTWKALEDVYLTGYGSARIHHALTRWECGSKELQRRRDQFGSPSPYTAGDALCDLAAMVERAFEAFNNCPPDIEPGIIGPLFGGAQHAVGELEGLDLARVNTSILTRRNVPYRLMRVRDHCFELRETRNTEALGVDLAAALLLGSRADALLEKWKPFIIRDARACPLHWRFWRADTRDASGYIHMQYRTMQQDAGEDLLFKYSSSAQVSLQV
ncbi:hypothetical protein NMY22_g17918 [Coprinellus aureogranulatus]|nr:hypothetical protein NMY22_g17918 [Coprinellus aureogranulatus]